MTAGLWRRCGAAFALAFTVLMGSAPAYAHKDHAAAAPPAIASAGNGTMAGMDHSTGGAMAEAMSSEAPPALPKTRPQTFNLLEVV